ncbi:signal peptidase II [Aestuariispira insulae]|uniref:Lipoprotein signal peptidase n=1 Tax=Aestuariispira insulae TaxID=1461337 RepID=A0A3D9HGB6_9PROT|nr:signal peptidase II [Aestuariispira insulae]RED48529.1 signal peptidase II [Aestuariispira insulae]
MSDTKAEGQQGRFGRVFWIGIGVAFVALILDQASKWAVMEILFGYDFWTPADSYPAAFGREVTSFFNLVAVWNRGVSFGLFANGSPWGILFLCAMALGIVAVLLFMLTRENRAYMAITIGLIIGGAIGNVLDRVRFGAVFDFLDFHGWIFNIGFLNGHWPSFNISDSLIFIGVGLWLLEGLFQKGDKKPEA